MEKDNSEKVGREAGPIFQDAQQIHNRLCTMEVQLTQELEGMMRDKLTLYQELRNVYNVLPDINQLESSVQNLKSLLTSTSSLAEQVCRRVRRSDVARANASECLARINDLLDLRACRFGVRRAMITEDFEEAAIHIKRFLQMNENEMSNTIELIRSKPNFANIPEKKEIDVQSMTDACRDVRQAKQDLIRLLQARMTRAIQENDFKSIERYFKLFPLIGEHVDGLERYSRYLSSKVLSPGLMEKFTRSNVMPSDKLAALFENVAKLIDSNQPFVETYYGPGHLLVVVRALQTECDKQSRKLLEEFKNVSNLQKLAKSVRKSNTTTNNNANSSNSSHNLSSTINNSNDNNNQLGGQPSTSDKLDPRDIDQVLNDVSTIISRSEVYLNFVTQRVRDDILAGYEDPRISEQRLLDVYRVMSSECDLSILTYEVSNVYVMMEQYYMYESSHKAIAMDQLDDDPASPVTSSMLDEVFFIIKKCTKRAASTRSSRVFCAIINHTDTLLKSTLAQTLNERLRTNRFYTLNSSLKGSQLDLIQAYSAALQSGRYLQSSGDQERGRSLYLSSLNNLERGGVYIEKLRSILDSEIHKLNLSLKALLIQRHLREHHEEKELVNGLTSINNEFHGIARTAIQQLFASSFKPRLRGDVQKLLSDNPDMMDNLGHNDDEKNRHDELASVANTLISSIEPTLRSQLTSANFEYLVSLTRDFVDAYIKKLIR